MPASRPLSAGSAALVFVGLFCTALVLVTRNQAVPVELEAGSSGAGYLSKGVEGIAAKVLLEQAQEAAEVARKRLEKAAEYHNKAEDDKQHYLDLKKREAEAHDAIKRDEEEAAEAEKKGAAALVEAREALQAQEEHQKQADEAKAASDELSKKAVELDDEGQTYKSKADDSEREAEKAREVIRNLRAQIAEAIKEMDELKRQLIARNNWAPPSEDGQEDRGSPLQLASLGGRSRYSGSASRGDLSSARNPLAQGVSDKFVPLSKTSDQMW